ncbi:MAG: serine/threonine protein kinase, partial [Kofleriaceae bacterium]
DGTLAPVIHRDISPHNVLLGVNGGVKLSDFGLARARDRIASLTAPGTVKGKLSYLAPEVAFGKPNTVQSDLFGVGNILWETLTGERLFDGKTDVEIFKKIRACEVPSITTYRKSDPVPAALLAVLDTALTADSDGRFANADEFAHALSQVMKQAVGINPGAALGTAVAEARTRLRATATDPDDQSTTEHPKPAASDPVLLTKPKKAVDPAAVTAPALKHAPPPAPPVLPAGPKKKA